MISTSINGNKGQYRIGAVAKMTGITVATLRVWQARYQVVEPSTSQGGQRLYSDLEVKKLSLIKGLNQAGHSIGLISGLSLEQLQELAFKHQQVEQTPASASLVNPRLLQETQPAWSGATVKSLCLVGGGLMARLNSLRYAYGLAQLNLELHQVSDLSELLKTLEDNSSVTQSIEVSCFLIKLNSTSRESLDELQALRKRLPRARIAVLYHYAQTQELQAMQALSIELKRETLSSEELLEWIKALLLKASADESQEIGLPKAKERMFSDEALAHFAQIDNPFLCECPKHLAQIVEQLVSFEQYSLHCLNSSPKDEALHASLHQVSSICRAMFEQSLQQVIKHEGLELVESNNAEIAGSSLG
jgi:MerR family transcriptional regulator, light-induced transcriptional regulator